MSVAPQRSPWLQDRCKVHALKHSNKVTLKMFCSFVCQKYPIWEYLVQTLFSSLTLTSRAVSAWVDRAWTLLILVISPFCFLVSKFFFHFSWRGKDRFLYISGDNRWADIDHNETRAWQVRMLFKQSKKKMHCTIALRSFSFLVLIASSFLLQTRDEG